MPITEKKIEANLICSDTSAIVIHTAPDGRTKGLVITRKPLQKQKAADKGKSFTEISFYNNNKATTRPLEKALSTFRVKKTNLYSLPGTQKKERKKTRRNQLLQNHSNSLRY